MSSNCNMRFFCKVLLPSVDWDLLVNGLRVDGLRKKMSFPSIGLFTHSRVHNKLTLED